MFSKIYVEKLIYNILLLYNDGTIVYKYKYTWCVRYRYALHFAATLSGNFCNSTLVTFIATPSGKFLWRYSRKVSAVDPVNLKKSMYR